MIEHGIVLVTGAARGQGAAREAPGAGGNAQDGGAAVVIRAVRHHLHPREHDVDHGETAGELRLKDEKGIVRTIPAATIEERSKAETSLMPADIQKLMTAAELVDLVEYLSTLKERRGVRSE